MRIKRRRKKNAEKRAVVGRNCRFISYRGGAAVCGLRDGEECRKTRSCGYEEESRTIDRLKEELWG